MSVTTDELRQWLRESEIDGGGPLIGTTWANRVRRLIAVINEHRPVGGGVAAYSDSVGAIAEVMRDFPPPTKSDVAAVLFADDETPI